MAVQVDIYTTPTCGYCRMAKQLLTRKNVAYREIDVASDAARRAEMMSRSGGGRTVPQIFIGDTHVGGCDDLYALNDEGGLDRLLGAQAAS
jgi:glutaredoxin 3